MEQRRNRKRKIGNRLFSLMLALALAMSNIQITSGINSTVWAAENSVTETAEQRKDKSTDTFDEPETSEREPSKIAQSSEIDSDNESEETEDTASETSEHKETESSETKENNTQETIETDEDEQTEKTTESNSSEETEEDSQIEETTETLEANTTEEEETTEEVHVNNVEESDSNPVEEQVEVIIHFKNSLGWGEVAAAYSDHDGNNWTNGYTGEWPGLKQEKDENGYYTIRQKKPKSSGFAIIFNNNIKDNGQQTQDIIISSSEFTSNAYELWVCIDGEEGGKKKAVISETEIISPEIRDDKKVTFRYKNDSATKVQLAGDMTEWAQNPIDMTKDTNGVFTYTIENALEAGSYKYKFIVDGNWIRDPNNESFTDDNDKNSIFTIEGDDPNRIVSPEVNENTVTFRYKNSNVNTVRIVGSTEELGNWTLSKGKEMKKDATTGIHTFEIDLPHGEYLYKFVYADDNDFGNNVDNNIHWILDPSNSIKIKDKDSEDNYNSGVYVPGTEITEYTIHYYNPSEQSGNTPDLHIWDACTENAGQYSDAFQDCAFDNDKTITEGGKTWRTLITSVPYDILGLKARVKAGEWTSGEDDKDWTYQKTTIGSKVELWYVHGDGIYEENPYAVPEGLNPPKLTIVKGTTATLPSKLTKGSEDGTTTDVDVTYTMAEVAGVTLEDTKKQITVTKNFTGTSVELTATETNGTATVTFEIKVVEDKNQITIKLHYSRPNGDYENWNVWAWSEGAEGQDGARYDFKEVNGEKVATITLDGRKNSKLGYIVRKSEDENDWVEKDPNKELDRFIDLSEILSGTVDCYIESGKDAVREELAEDILKGIKICSIELDKENNRIKVVTGNPIDGADLQKAFAIKLADGTEVAINKVTAESNQNEYTLEPTENLAAIDMLLTNKFYTISFDGYDYKLPVGEARILYSSKEFEDAFTYTGNDLGATWTKEKTTFKVWAPTANKVEVKLYTDGEVDKGSLKQTIPMTKGDKGVWVAEQTGDLNGTYYTYAVTIDGETTEACDPYARTTGVNGNRAMVLDLEATDPEGWAEDVGPNQGMDYTDSVIYELHVRDFSIDASSGISDKNKGKFLGLTEKGTTNATGQTTGLDYLKDLGVTHIHLLPSYDYATVDETKLDTPQYNWGYDPKNYNVPEGSYSTDPYRGDVRVKEMKQMVKVLHDNNINVIMDVVYNHVYDADKFCFNQIVPQYFSRTKKDGSYSNGSGCGNDTASERAMVKKYIVDSVNYWADEYHIDGFRFDLVGLLDTETINEVVETVHKKHPNAVFYGEGWDMSTEMSKDGYTMATQGNASKTPQFAYFSDTIRDLLKGGNNETDLGFVSGLTGREEPMANCFRALAWWSSNPTQIVNYASCHDNYTLKDKLDATAGKTNSQADVIKMNNLAAAIYLTAEGIPLIHAGEEILREKKDQDGKIDHNSYKSSDAINSIKWANLNKEEYRQTRDYYKGLIAFRKNHAALRLTTAEAVAENVQYHWITNEVIMFVINGKESVAGEISDGIVIIFNATNSKKSVDLFLKDKNGNNIYGIAQGTWNVCVNDKKAGTEILDTITDGKVEVAPISAMILVKGEVEDILIQRQKLQSLIENCQIILNQGQGTYTDERWKAFTDALKDAKAVLNNTEASLTDINNAYDKLEKAQKGLEESGSIPVDKQKLQLLIKDCQAVLSQGQNNYTDESWQAFQTILESANAVLNKTDATQDEVNIAIADLQKALDGLTVPEGVVDTGKLKALIDTCKTIFAQGQANYTDESWQAFTDALNEAQAVLENANATQTEIDNVRKKLETARDTLTNKKPNTEALEALILECDKVEKGNYTNESWKVFADAFNAAKAVAGNPDATQEEIDNAEQKLRTAYDGLKVPEGMIDKGKLKALVDTCKELLNKGQGSFTEESWKVFTVALEEAEAVLADQNVTQIMVDDARNKLESAQDNLTSVALEVEALKSLIKEYEKVTEEIYTKESWNVFADALDVAKAITSKPDVTLDEVRKTTDDLRKAFEGLTKVKEGLWSIWAADTGLTLDEQGNYHIPYTGKAIKPAILVYDGNTLLREKTDYMITYQNNTNAGPASVLIKGKGNYSKEHRKNFIIDAIDFDSLDIADLYAAVASNNVKQIAPKPVVKYNGKTLKLNKDYAVKYENPQTDGKELGAYNVIVTAKSSNFINSKTIRMTLVDKNSVRLMSKTSIGKIAKEDTQYEFDETTRKGKVLMPILTVKYGKDTLKLQTDKKDPTTGDYTVTYDEVHTEAGETATITIRGNGVDYVGEKTISFKITGTSLKTNQVSLNNVPKAGLVYTGTKQEPEISIVGMSPEEVEHYTVKTYQKNINVGTATVVVTGRNGYIGTVKKTFKITAYDIFADAEQKFVYNKDTDNTIPTKIPYAKGDSKLSDEQLGARFLVGTASATVYLEQGKDYTLSYKNNKKIGTASVTIKGKGNYKGTIKNIPFTIVEQELAALECNITAADILEKNAAKYNKVIPVLTDFDGKTLKNKTDFIIDTDTAYTDEGDNKITETPKVGDTIKVTVKAKEGGNYKGMVSTTFRVIGNDKSLSKAVITVTNQIYTGLELKPTSADEAVTVTIKVKENGTTITKTLKEHEDYEIIGYAKNINKGTAKITIHGIGTYGGTKTGTFKIVAQEMK